MVTSIPNTRGVYRIRNIMTNRCYIGSSRQMRTRIREHMRTLDAGTHHCVDLQADWREWGDDAFVAEVLRVVEKAERWFEQQAIDAHGNVYNTRLCVWSDCHGDPR